jgi:hypothetical protein
VCKLAAELFGLVCMSEMKGSQPQGVQRNVRQAFGRKWRNAREMQQFSLKGGFETPAAFCA